MIEYLKEWVMNLSIFIVVVTFLEMILPNGNIRKYVKMTIGMLTILVILNPFISLIKSNINIDSEVIANLNEHEVYNYSTETSTDIQQTQNEQAMNIYKVQLDEEINKIINNESVYKVSNVDIKVCEEAESNEYGSVEAIDLILTNNTKEKDNNYVDKKKGINIDEIEINIKNISKDKVYKDSLQIKDSTDVNNLKKVLSKEFELSSENIRIKFENIKEEEGD